MNSSFKERLEEVIVKHFDGKVKSLTDLSNIPYTTLNEFKLGKKTNPKIDLILAICKSVPGLSPAWLAFGESPSETEISYVSRKKVKLIPNRGRGLLSYTSKRSKEELMNADNYVLPLNEEVDFLDFYFNEDMNPDIKPGDLVGIKLLKSKHTWQWGKIYFLETLQGNFAKRVFPNDSDDKLTLRSSNPEYLPIEVELESLISIGIVSVVISKK